LRQNSKRAATDCFLAGTKKHAADRIWLMNKVFYQLHQKEANVFPQSFNYHWIVLFDPSYAVIRALTLKSVLAYSNKLNSSLFLYLFFLYLYIRRILQKLYPR